MRKLISDYRKAINPPYSSKDFPVIVGTLLVLLLTIALAFTLPNRYKSEHTKLSSAQQPPPAVSERAVPDEILLKFKPGASTKTKNSVRHAFGLIKKEELSQIDVEIVKIPPVDRGQAINALKNRPEVEFAEVNAVVKPEVVPNDPYYTSAWHLPKIYAPGAWDISKATNIFVGMCDTGVATVEDLTPVLRTDLGWNSADGTTNWSPITGHGTLTSGAVAAATNNSIGVSGVAWDAKIIPVRISNISDGSAFVSDAAKCINYTADRGARIINLSYRMAGYATIDSAGQYAQGKGALTFVAAGNDGTNPGWPNYPGFLAVSAINNIDVTTSWSNYGAFVDIAAPGQSIMTTRSDGAYGTASGTSLASPVAAGVGALIFGANPSLSAAQAQNIILTNSDDLGSSGWDANYGWGRVDALRAVNSAAGLPPDTTSPSVSITTPIAGSTVSGQAVSIKASASDNFGVLKVEIYIDGTLFATSFYSSSGSYNFTWDSRTVSNGSHTLAAKAYDGSGNVGTSSPVTITVANASDIINPTVSITSPVNGSTVSGIINVAADASDNVGVAKVVFSASNFNQTVTSAPYTTTWDTTKTCSGSCSAGLSATAYDAAGNYTSTSIWISINNTGVTPTSTPIATPTPTSGPAPTNTPTPTPGSSDSTSPIVTITNPLAGSTVAVRSNVSIQATASDNVGVTRVDFLINGTLKCSDSISPYVCSWNVPGAKNKTYTITARAYDAAGNNSQSSIAVTSK